MKKLLALLLTVLLAACPAMAEGLEDFEAYSEALLKLYGGEWKEEGDVRVLKAGEEASISVCLEGGDVAAVTAEALRDGDLRDTAYAALNALGGLTSGTLFAISDLENAQLEADGCVIGHLAGETRECVYIAQADAFAEMVWEPVHGGDQLHALPTCSGMDVPRLITAEAGEKTGYDGCDHCMKAEKANGKEMEN